MAMPHWSQHETGLSLGLAGTGGLPQLGVEGCWSLCLWKISHQNSEAMV